MAGDAKPQVAVVFASENDLGVMSEAIQALEEFGIAHEVEVTSAHRSPQRTHDYVHAASARGVKLFIVGAGAAAHIAGVIASLTPLPVIGVPLANTALNGADALYATVQMPAGVPVATMALDKAGARNAGIFAAEVLALSDPALADRVRQFKEKLAQSVAERADRVKQQLKAK
ncbi:MAG: 5-(carboxyamino)imidazole ribonucleotide mutase [Acidobacteria bacterium]|nr:5-(carboxyamino)imidazole ribonucleotide mutase [Acidobacteriota bacterium]